MTGHDPQVGQASDQATVTRWAGSAPVSCPSGQIPAEHPAPGAKRFTSHSRAEGPAPTPPASPGRPPRDLPAISVIHLQFRTGAVRDRGSQGPQGGVRCGTACGKRPCPRRQKRTDFSETVHLLRVAQARGCGIPVADGLGTRTGVRRPGSASARVWYCGSRRLSSARASPLRPSRSDPVPLGPIALGVAAQVNRSGVSGAVRGAS